MMGIEVVLFGYFMTCVGAAGVADVVLSCTLVKDAVGLGGAADGAPFTRTSATLILRDIPVASDESMDALTPFAPPSVPDPNVIVFDSKVSSPDIPNAEVLLHADCNEQEVLCEISRYSGRGSEETSGQAYFMVSINVEGVDFSTTLILQTLALERDQSTLIQKQLDLPLSPSGVLLTEVVFLVFSEVKSVSAPLRGDTLLNCGFKLQELPTDQEVDIQWRVQHKGKGRNVLGMRTRPDDLEGSTVVHDVRGDSSMEAAQVVEGNASMSLTKLKVKDEGTYICTVSVGVFRGQQVIQLHVIQPPQVSLPEKLILNSDSSQTLSCQCSKYYPLDVQVEWSSLSPTDSEPTVFADQGSLSSHRQHGDGTYSLSFHLTVPSSVSAGTKILCTVSHPALDAPLSVSVMAENPEPDRYWLFLGFLIITALFFNQVMS